MLYTNSDVQEDYVSLIYIYKNVKDLGMMNEQLILAYIFCPAVLLL